MSVTKSSAPQSQAYVNAFGRKWPTRNVFAMTQQEIINVLLEIKESDAPVDEYLSERLRAALSYMRRYNDKTQEPIIKLKIVVGRESSRKRLSQLHPNEDDANN
jgi:hypothetical protein